MIFLYYCVLISKMEGMQYQCEIQIRLENIYTSALKDNCNICSLTLEVLETSISHLNHSLVSRGKPI